MSAAQIEVLVWLCTVLVLGGLIIIAMMKGLPPDAQVRGLFFGAVAALIARGTPGAGHTPPPAVPASP